MIDYVILFKNVYKFDHITKIIILNLRRTLIQRS